jgi:hypothetical protein
VGNFLPWTLSGVGRCAGILTIPDEYNRRMLAFFEAALLNQP